MGPPDSTVVVVVDHAACDDRELERLAARRPVIVRIDATAPGAVHAAFRLGARAVVARGAGDDELERAIDSAARGDTYLSPQLGARAVALADELSARERDVLRLIGLGHTNGEIGEALRLSTRTVEAHRARILAKLGITTRAELVRAAVARGLR